MVKLTADQIDWTDITTSKSKIIAVDTETTGLDPWGTADERIKLHPHRPFAISYTDYDFKCDYSRFDVNPLNRRVMQEKKPELLAKARAVLSDPSITKIFHNALFDITMLELSGVEVKGKIYDTKVLAHVADSSRFSYALKPLAKSLCGISDDDLTELKKSVMIGRREAKSLGWPVSEELEMDYYLGDPETCKLYATTDTIRTMALYVVYEDMLNNDAEYRATVDMEMELMLGAIYSMQKTGIAVDLTTAVEVKKYYDDLTEKFSTKKADLGYAELNPKSPKQMCKVFYDEKGLEKRYSKKPPHSLTVDAKALQAFEVKGDELAGTILRINAAGHALSSFINPIIDLAVKDQFGGSSSQIIHPNYNTTGPITGRLSCSKPNLMNIPSNDSAGRKTEVEYREREVFIPRPGHVLYFPDYSQVEVWVTMFLSRDRTGMDLLLSGADLHGALAKRIWGTKVDFEEFKKQYRKKAKSVEFGIIYGAGVKAIMDTIGCTVEEAMAIRTMFFEQHPGVKEYMDFLGAELRRNGFIKNPFGRKYYGDVEATYKMLNYMVQGSSADIMKRAIINVHNKLKTSWPKARILLNIHDELGIEVPLAYHSKKIMRDIICGMQGDFHSYIGIPTPLGVGMKYTKASWRDVIELDENLNPLNKD